MLSTIQSFQLLTCLFLFKFVHPSISVFGIPDKISNNDNQFVAKGFLDFAARYRFKLTTSSPHYPRHHGFIKRQGQTIKNVFNRCGEDVSGPGLALLQLRATPPDSRMPSLGKLPPSRQLKTTHPSIIRPGPNSEVVRASLQSRHDYSMYDAHAKELPHSCPPSL